MIPTFFPAMFLAEVKKVFSRGSGIATVVCSVLLGLLGAAALLGLQNAVSSGAQASANGTPVADMVKYSAVTAGSWALNARNFFVLPMLLLLCTASSLVGELNDRTLREVVVRPVSRLSVLLAKLLSLVTLSFVSLIATFVPALLVGLVCFGVPEAPADIGPLVLGYAASLASDLAVISLGLLASLFVGSVGGVVVGSVFLLLADLALWGMLQVLGMIGVSAAKELVPWTLGNALDAWQGWQPDGDGWEWQRFVALLVVFSLSSAATLGRFSRMDVP